MVNLNILDNQRKTVNEKFQKKINSKLKMQLTQK